MRVGDGMVKINRSDVIEASLELLNEVGLEALTLRAIARRLDVQAPALYWHFRSKDDLLDAMSTHILLSLGTGAVLGDTAPWTVWMPAYADHLRETLLGYRDGARLVSGRYLTDPQLFLVMEGFLQRSERDGLAPQFAARALATLSAFVTGFVIEEQAVTPVPGERDHRYDREVRRQRLEDVDVPLVKMIGEEPVANAGERFGFGLDALVAGFAQIRDTTEGL